MNVTKQQIQHGVVKYLENDVVKAIGDKPVMMIAAVIASMVKNSDSTVEKILEHPFVSLLLSMNEDGTYNLDNLFDAILSTLKTYGNFELPVPFLRKPLVFNADDFNNLKAYIEEGGGYVRKDNELLQGRVE